MTSKLLIDAGNTRVKAGLMDQDGHLEPYFNHSYADLDQQQLDPAISVVWLAQTGANEKQSRVDAWLQQTFGDAQPQVPVHRVNTEKHAFGVTNAYETPSHLGIDRWLTLIGAHNEAQRPTLIIDAGTAITVDWLAADGQHLGGWIVPGIDLMMQSITQRTPKVFANTELGWGKPQVLGQSTPECLANGCASALVGVIRQALAVSETELDWFDYRLLFSGGSIPLVPNDLKRRGELRTELVLQGLACYAKAL